MFQWEAEEARTFGEFKTAYLAGIDKNCLKYITN
jgi:hypothetical protein